MTSREGPKASVVLSCDGCVHRKEIKTPHTLRLECDAKGKSMTLGLDTPSWCPVHPGKLVAVPIPRKHDITKHVAKPSLESRMLDNAWNDCRQKVVDSAHALGQEIAE